MATRITVAQYTLFDGLVSRTHFKFRPGEYMALRNSVELTRCATCWDRTVSKRKARSLSYYSDPWADGDPDTTEYYCSEDCEEAARDGDFAPMWCEGCSREVVQRCPGNGYRGYFMEHPNGYGELICVACYQRIMLADGHSEEHFADGARCHADFYSDADLRGAGYEEVQNYFLPSEFAAYRAMGRALLGEGRVVITNLDRSGMGLEGYVTIWAKEGQDGTVGA